MKLVGHQSGKPSPPITAEDEGQATNQTVAMTQPYLHDKMGRGTQHKTSKETTELTRNVTL